MRKLSYAAKMAEDYIIMIGEYHGYRNAPKTNIRMTVKWPAETHSDVKDFFEIKALDRVAPPNPEFIRLLPQILQGETTSWRLRCVAIRGDSILIEFVNDALEDEKQNLCFQHKREEAQAICSMIVMQLIPCGRRGQDSGMTMRFEVPLPDGSGVSTTLVEICPRGVVKVTELDANDSRVVRVLKFFNMMQDESGVYHDDAVIVTEYSW